MGLEFRIGPGTLAVPQRRVLAVALARHLGADPERALRETNLKFERRFGAIERALAAQGRTPEQATLAEMDALWDEAKQAEREA